MTEKDIAEWIAGNWPTLFLTLALARSYIKIRAIPIRIRRLERTMKRVLEVCAKQHGDQALFLLRDDEEKDQDE